MSKQARLRTQEMRAAQAEAARRESRRRRVVMLVGGLLILGLVAAITVAVVRASNDGGDSGGGGGEVVVPAHTRDGAIPVGEQGAPVTVTIYYDYMCPACGKFEEANGDELTRLLDAGKIAVDLRPISFLDRASSGTRYSTRSANAVATVADASLDDVWAFHTALYADQPQEGSTGLSDEEIAQVAEKAGVPADVVGRFEDGTHEGWVAEITQQAFDSGVEGTPTVLIDGENFEGDVYTPGPLTQAIEAAAGS